MIFLKVYNLEYCKDHIKIFLYTCHFILAEKEDALLFHRSKIKFICKRHFDKRNVTSTKKSCVGFAPRTRHGKTARELTMIIKCHPSYDDHLVSKGRQLFCLCWPLFFNIIKRGFSMSSGGAMWIDYYFWMEHIYSIIPLDLRTGYVI